uniref:GRIP domain-containing protein n=1 Tax=Sus scrofa TaxID=9823 RepID=A0A8D2BHT4_PIG
MNSKSDVCTLQEEKGKRVEKCKEREMETQALQETNVQLSMMLREKDSEIVTIKEKALALEHLLKEQEHGNTEQLSQILNALTATQEKTILTQRERDEATLLLKRKQIENSALQSQVQHFHEKELSFKKDLERLHHQAAHSEESYKLQTLMAEERAAQLGMRVSTLEEKLLLSSRALEEASQQLSLSQQQEKQAVQALANMKTVLAEWMAKADHLEGQLLSAHKLQEKAQAALHGKEDQIKDLKKQTAVQQEVLDDLQEKLMNLRSDAEGKVDKSLMKNLFMGYFQTPKPQRPEVFQIIGSTLGIEREAMQVLLNEEQVSGPRWMTRWLGSKSGPGTPLEPNQQSAMPKMSFSELFVKYLDTESHHTLPLLKPSASGVKPSNAAGRKQTAQNIQLHLQTTFGSTPKKPEVKVGSLSLSLVNPPGPEPGGSGHLLLNAITDVVPTYPPLLLPPGKNAGAGLKDLSKQRMVL